MLRTIVLPIVVYHGNLLLTKKHTNVRAHNNIINIKCLPTDDWDCERPNP